jgi:general secretion pathway protein D
VTFNLERADLAELTRHIAALTKKRFIYDHQKLSGIEVSVVSPTKVSVDAAYAAYLTVLQQHGMSVVQQGEFWKIVEGSLVGSLPPLHDERAPLPEGALPVTHIHRVEHVRASDAATVLGHFASPNGDVSVYEPGRMLIITDTAAHVARLLRLLEEIDVERVGARLWVEPVHYAGAARIAQQINDVFSVGTAGASSILRVVADDATNRLLIIGSEAGYASVLALLRRIDVAPAAEGRVHVVALEHAVAEDLEQTLSRLLGDSGAGKGEGATARIGSFEGTVRVTADKATNALIVTASSHDYAELRPVLDELDRKPRQVFIEAVVLELSSDDRSRLGVGYHGAGTANLLGQASSLIFGGMNAAQSTPNASQLQALALGVRGPDVPGTEGLLAGDSAGLSIPAFGIALQALAISATSDVLATPHIIALDNTTAEISVGDNIPLQVNSGASDLSSLATLLGSATGDAASASAASALGGLGGTARQDVGTRISITPHINDKNQVRLDIEEEISQQGTISGDLGVVSIVQRSARTSVVVDDEQTVVIGGLVRDAQRIEDEKVPFLGDLPLLGALFRQRASRTEKTNLILILTPHVIASRADLQRVFERKMEERQEFLDRFFVFNSGWEPDTDLSRASGLVEKVRQALRAGRERRQLELDRLPARPEGHEPSAPIELPPDMGPRALPGAVPVSQREPITSSCRTG